MNVKNFALNSLSSGRVLMAQKDASVNFQINVTIEPFI